MSTNECGGCGDGGYIGDLCDNCLIIVKEYHNLIDESVAKRLISWLEAVVRRGEIFNSSVSAKRDGIEFVETLSYYTCKWCRVEGLKGQIKHPVTCLVRRIKEQALRGETIYGKGCFHCGGSVDQNEFCKVCGADYS